MGKKSKHYPGWGWRWEFIAAAETNGLLNNLIAYWPGNEVNGNALDLHVNALHLTDVHTVTSNPGLSYPLARQYTKANSEHHDRPGDDALLSAGDLDFTIAQAMRFDTWPVGAGFYATCAKWGYLTNAKEYLAGWSAASGRLEFRVSSNGAAESTVAANALGGPLTNTWYWLVAWHDSVADTINVQVNDGIVDSAAFAAGVADKTYKFQLGATVATNFMDGRLGPTMFWKSAPGGGGVLTAAQRTALWNGGTPLQYTEFTT
jgi:hypothetical protein